MFKLSICCAVLLCVSGLEADICGPEEDYNKCGPMCEPTCANRHNIKIACVAACIESCYCKPGLLRNIDGRCVLAFDCFNKQDYVCPANEYFNTCAQPSRCLTCTNPRICEVPTCNGGCNCVAGYLRTANGTCISQYQCPQQNGIPTSAQTVSMKILEERTDTTLNRKTTLISDVDKGPENLGRFKEPKDEGTPKAPKEKLPLTNHKGTPDAPKEELPLASRERVPKTLSQGPPLASREKKPERKIEKPPFTSHKVAPEGKIEKPPLASHEVAPETQKEESPLASHEVAPETQKEESPSANSEAASDHLSTPLIKRKLIRKIQEIIKLNPARKQNDET